MRRPTATACASRTSLQKLGSMVQAYDLGANSGSVGRQGITSICACTVHETRADAAIAGGMQRAQEARM